MRLQRRVLREEMDPFEIPDSQFKQLFRLNEQLTINLINDLLPYIPQRNNLSVDKKGKRIIYII